MRKVTKRTIYGTAERPRLSVSISNRQVTAQVIDDDSGKTLAYSTSLTDGAKAKTKAKTTMSDKAALVGSNIAKKALKLDIKQVVFDRGTKLYHGRVKALADAARKEGLEF
ncbi:MAG: 50S ribosomal protein L18 [Candidatus Saccharimonadales bacterium]